MYVCGCRLYPDPAHRDQFGGGRDPGAPGGTVMASLGLITGILGFDADGTALMLAIFALQDSFGTACNVTGDGALTLILTGYVEKHKNIDVVWR